MPPDRLDDLGAALANAPFAVVGQVTEAAKLRYMAGDAVLAALDVADAEAAWKRPLDVDGTLTQEATR